MRLELKRRELELNVVAGWHMEAPHTDAVVRIVARVTRTLDRPTAAGNYTSTL